MNHFKDLMKQFKEEERENNLSKNRVIILKQEWLKENGKQCEKCERTDNLTIDHIIPASFVKEFGIDEIKTFMPENYRVLCRICNHYKGDRLDFSDKRTKELLIKFLEKV